MDTSKQQFEKINQEANKIIIYLIAISLNAGGLVYFIAYYFLLDAKNMTTVYRALFICILGLLALLLRKLKLNEDALTISLGFILVLTYFYLFSITERFAFLTVWGSIFIFMSIGLIYINRTILYMQLASATMIMIYSIMDFSVKEVKVESSDLFGRYGIILIVFVVAMYANKLYKKRMIDNLDQYSKIVEQKESITQLYEEVQASEEELISQNDALNASYKKINQLAFYDSLTQLPNKNKMVNDIEIMESTDINDGSHCTFILIDIDNFKNINDLHTHEIGDRFLIYVAENLKSLTQDYGYKVYRVGSDDFVILTKMSKTLEPITTLLNQLIIKFKEPMIHEGYAIGTSLSIGISESISSGLKAQILLRNADIALNVAKKRGKNNYVYFDKMIEKKLMRKLHLQDALQSVLETNELYMEYQPIYHIATREIVGFEALLRWQSKEYGFVSPMEFITYAEENMTIIPIGIWVIEEGIKFIQRLNKQYNQSFRIAINVSNVQLSNRQFLNELDEILKKNKADTHLIDFEITERVVIDSYENTAILLSSLRELGISISLDDFGTGYSSLSYLQDLPIDNIKIDRSFVQGLNETDNPLVDTIITMAHRMNLEVVAEGVETMAQLEILNERHCNYVQGFYFSKPLREEGIMAYLDGLE